MSGDRLTDHIPRPLPLFHLPLHIDVEYRSRGVERLHPVLVGQRAVKGQRTIRRQFGAVGVIRSISASSRRPDFGEAFPVQLGEPEGCLLYTSGLVVFGERNGISPTFTSYKTWVGRGLEADHQEAAKELVRKYLHCYGPATPDLFVTWLGCSKKQGRRLWELAAQELSLIHI